MLYVGKFREKIMDKYWKKIEYHKPNDILDTIENLILYYEGKDWNLMHYRFRENLKFNLKLLHYERSAVNDF